VKVADPVIEEKSITFNALSETYQIDEKLSG